MKVEEKLRTTIKKDDTKTTIVSFDSISEFYSYICNTPINETFRWATLSSSATGFDREKFTGTKSFEHASELMRNGWSDMSKKLTKNLKAIEKDVAPMTRNKTIYDVAGYQCSVPRYLNNVPTSMIRTKSVIQKQKVVNLVKSISYNSGISTKTIEEESIKALQIVKKIEAQGYRTNLSIALGAANNDKEYLIKVKIKNASEKLNISKVAFPLVHPSMLRRLFLRFIEVYPTIEKQFKVGYGRPVYEKDMLQILNKNETLLPEIIDNEKVENYLK